MTPIKKDPNLEDALRNALGRKDVPDGFTLRVLARVEQQNSRREVREISWLKIFSRPLMRWAAFAAVSIGLIASGTYYRNLQRERAQGEAAKQQLMLALRIAGSKLQLAKTKVKEVNQPQTRSRPRPIRSRS